MAKFRHNLHSQIRKIMKNSIKKVQSQTGLNSAERENVGLKVKKYIELSEEVIARLVSGKSVEGSLHRDQWTGKVTFRAYNRKSRNRYKDKLIKKLPWGWVKESMTRIKVHESMPKDLGTARILSILDDQNRQAKNALIDRELIENY